MVRLPACLPGLLLGSLAYGQCVDGLLAPPQAPVFTNFGAHMDAAGGVVAVGDPWENSVSGAFDSGAVYIYRRGAGGWEYGVRLERAIPVSGDELGERVAVDEDALAAVSLSDSGTPVGSVVIFEPSGGTWSEVASFQGVNSQVVDDFGQSLAIDDGVLAVGAPRRLDPSCPGTWRGAVDVFERQPGGWTPAGTLTVPAGHCDGGWFGHTLDLDGGWLVVSSSSTVLAGQEFGLLYFYRRLPQGWSLVQTLRGPSSGYPDYFGRALDLEDGRLVVQVPGAWRVYELDTGGTWGAVDELAVPEPRNTWSEVSVALDGDELVTLIGWGLDEDVAIDRFVRVGAEWEFRGRITRDGYRSVRRAGDHALLAPPIGFDTAVEAIHFDRGLTPFCFCDEAPCGDDYGSGGCAKNSGNGLRLVPCGSSSLAADDLRLRVIGGHPLHPLHIIASTGPAPPRPFATGILCLDPSAMTRPFPVTYPGPAGNASYGPGVLSASGLPLLPGASATFQAVTVGAHFACPGDNLLLSNAVLVELRP